MARQAVTAVLADTDVAREVHHQSYREVVERQFGPWDPAFQDRRFADDWAGGSGYSIVLCDGEPGGHLCLEERVDHLHVREIVIAPAFQGRRIGTALLRQVLRHAGERRLPVRLGTLHANRAAALYRRLGFQEVGRTPTHLLFAWQPPAGSG
jgi:GNAT superfamily N-acetyltransferase